MPRQLGADELRHRGAELGDVDLARAVRVVRAEDRAQPRGARVVVRGVVLGVVVALRRERVVVVVRLRRALGERVVVVALLVERRALVEADRALPDAFMTNSTSTVGPGRARP